ncbi:MAG TPA: hydrogenase 4 subunit F, partial [Lamprocystis sp. (in: g-proteobacteria)]|nr:hydrogenase 4 subunit F [Lamprocystis sp. (in: g-proteobacteria)]
MLVLLTPLLGALVLRLLRAPTVAGWFNLGVSIVSLGAALWLGAAVAVSGEVSGSLAEQVFGASAGL